MGSAVSRQADTNTNCSLSILHGRNLQMLLQESLSRIVFDFALAGLDPAQAQVQTHVMGVALRRTSTRLDLARFLLGIGVTIAAFCHGLGSVTPSRHQHELFTFNPARA